MIAFCTTCKGRAQHIKQTLPRNLADNASYPRCKFILLDYSSTDDLVEYLKTNHQADIDSGRLVVYTYNGADKFHMAHAKNMVHRLGMLEGADILCNLDADNYTNTDFANYLDFNLGRSPRHFMWSRMVKEGPNRLPRGISGRIAVSSQAFLAAGGYDEQYAVWSPDDKDFNLRLQRLGYFPEEIEPYYLRAVLHNDKMRFREYPEAHSDHTNEDHFEEVADKEETIVNYGKIGMGTVYRNFDFDNPIVLGPVPTRIFGIGMHKTATTSLHAAFQILGYDSAHWKDAHWAKAIFDQMLAAGRSLTLEHHYALCDLPITVLYEQLDNAYPGSKFVLTTRNEADWLQSVRNHWDHNVNPFRQAWATDPFTHRIHKYLYGQKGFDESIFLARYRKHNTDVLAHFKDRPNDLLVMDMDKKDGWQELCGFLSKPIPNVPYPRYNAVKPKS